MRQQLQGGEKGILEIVHSLLYYMKAAVRDEGAGAAHTKCRSGDR